MKVRSIAQADYNMDPILLITQWNPTADPWPVPFWAQAITWINADLLSITS